MIFEGSHLFRNENVSEVNKMACFAEMMSLLDAPAKKIRKRSRDCSELLSEEWIRRGDYWDVILYIFLFHLRILFNLIDKGAGLYQITDSAITALHGPYICLLPISWVKRAPPRLACFFATVRAGFPTDYIRYSVKLS